MSSPGHNLQAVDLVGRDAECGRIDALLEVARAEVGIGKTALLRYALEQAGSMTVLRARGIESESELAFAVLGDFFRPAVDRLEAIPEPQAAALAGALALGPPAPSDRFTVCAATLSLLAAVAEDAPVLGVIDDAQWLDRSSAEALLFAARRLDSEGVSFVFGLREGEAGPFDARDLDELVLAGLDEDDALELLSRRLGYEPQTAVADRLVRATEGNPLALVEIPTLLSESQLTGAESMEEPLPAAPTIERAFLHQIE